MHPTFAQRAAIRATGFVATGEAASVVRLAVPGAARAGSGGRWGLVLGGGGVLGAAWLVGALEALERARGIDARQAEVILGTSAGSVVGALLAAGVSVADLRAQQLGEQDPTAELTARLAGVAFDPERPTGDALPPRPRLRPGSPALLRNNRGALREIPRTTLLAGLAPAGRAKMVGVAQLVEAFVPAGEVFVLAPMASAAYDAPGDWRARVERRLRVASTRRCLAEAREVQLRGTAVTVLGPGPEDLQLMGYNLMAPERRRAVLESAVRTGTAAFSEPPAVKPGIRRAEPLMTLDLDVNRSEHG
jgi:hypothetical protein